MQTTSQMSEGQNLCLKTNMIYGHSGLGVWLESGKQGTASQNNDNTLLALLASCISGGIFVRMVLRAQEASQQ